MEYGAACEEPSEPDMACRMRELEEDNARLRLLVRELLVENQRLREDVHRSHVSERHGAPAA